MEAFSRTVVGYPKSWQVFCLLPSFLLVPKVKENETTNYPELYWLSE